MLILTFGRERDSNNRDKLQNKIKFQFIHHGLIWNLSNSYTDKLK